MSRQLPAKPNLEHIKKQAKELLHDFHEGVPDATERFRSVASLSTPATAKLADAQHVLARDYGFATWPKLKEHVESLVRVLEPAEQLSAAVCASDANKVSRALREHPELKSQLNEPMANYGDGMQALLAAVQRSDRKTIDVLLRAGADINVRSRSWAGGRGVLDECAPEMAAFLNGTRSRCRRALSGTAGNVRKTEGTRGCGLRGGPGSRRERANPAAFRLNR